MLQELGCQAFQVIGFGNQGFEGLRPRPRTEVCYHEYDYYDTVLLLIRCY